MEQKEQKPRIPVFKILLNLLIMVAILFVLGWLALCWLDVWTGHGDEQKVPSVSGMSYDAAVEKLLDEGFKVELSDSVYEAKAKPGQVIDQTPKEGTLVKEGRVIYLTVNAFYPKTVTIPHLTDMSVRQARSILEGLGISNVVEVPVFSEYKDLVLGAKYNNKRLAPGARVPVNAKIVLEVGDGMPDISDTIYVDTMTVNSAATQGETLELF